MKDIKKEIARVEEALAKTTSWQLKKDYTKYLKRLKQQLIYSKTFLKITTNKLILINGDEK